MQDVVRFVGEGIRADVGSGSETRIKESHIEIPDPRWEDAGDSKDCDSEKSDDLVNSDELVKSYLALAVVLFVYPQLDAIRHQGDEDQDRLRKAVRKIFTSFGIEIGRAQEPGVAEIPLMWRIDKRADRTGEGSALRLISTQTLADYLLQNLKTQFPYSQPEKWFDGRLEPWLSI
jgi:hypothetical protein